VFGEQHLRHLLKSYQNYYNEARTHLSLRRLIAFSFKKDKRNPDCQETRESDLSDSDHAGTSSPEL
jgi:hypothetical protein